MISSREYGDRLKRLQEKLSSEKIDAFIVLTEPNLRYLLGFDTGKVLVTKDTAICWAKESYWDRIENKNFELMPYEPDVVSDHIKSRGYKNIGVEDLTWMAIEGLKKKLKKSLKPSLLIEEMRKIKSRAEIDLLEKSAKIAKKGMKKAEEVVDSGLTELEVASEVEYVIRRAGSIECPFGRGILCCSGPNSKYPHAPLSDRKIKDGDLVVIDLGAVYAHYHSDMTRTFSVGWVSRGQEERMEFVKNLRDECIDRIKLGRPISELHNFSDKKIKEAGSQSSHLLGHGVGLEIHEKPSVGPDEKDKFQDRMVLTIEPGVYGKKSGVRFEDTVVVGNRVKRLTS